MGDTMDQFKSQSDSMNFQSSSNLDDPNKGNLIEQSKPGDSNFKSPIGFGKSPRTKPTRRSLSGAPLTTYLIETKFQHFRAFHSKQKETMGLNFLLAPPSGAIYRSSLPVTPIATPLFKQGLKFTEQSLHERMRKRLQSPSRRMFSDNIEPDLIEEQESQISDRSTSTTVSGGDRLAEKANEKSMVHVEPENNEDRSLIEKTKSRGPKAPNSKPPSEGGPSNRTRSQKTRRRDR